VRTSNTIYYVNSIKVSFASRPTMWSLFFVFCVLILLLVLLILLLLLLLLLLSVVGTLCLFSSEYSSCHFYAVYQDLLLGQPSLGRPSKQLEQECRTRSLPIHFIRPSHWSSSNLRTRHAFLSKDFFWLFKLCFFIGHKPQKHLLSRGGNVQYTSSERGNNAIKF
jgi:hypothetical protein